MAMGQVRIDLWLTIQVPLIVSNNCCTVSLKHWKKFRRCFQPVGQTEAKELSNLFFSFLPTIVIIDHTSR